MGAPSFTLEINLGRWAVGKSEAAQVLLRAFQEAGDQRFPDESLRSPAELAMAEIEMGEEKVTLRATCRMAPYEKVANALIEGDGGIEWHLFKRSGLMLRVAVGALSLAGRVDWEGTRERARERMAGSLARESVANLKIDAEENIKSMENHLGIR